MNRLFRRWDEIVTRPIHLWDLSDSTEKAVEAAKVAARSAADELLSRYAAARFPGVLRGIADLGRIAHVIKSARIYLEDGSVRRAEELLDLACRLQPETEALWLA